MNWLFEYSGLISFRYDWFDLAVQGALKGLLQHHNSKASILWHSAFSESVFEPSLKGFSGGSVVENLPAMQETPVLGRSPGEGNGNSLQYSCLENSMDRGVWWATIHGSQRVGHN